MRHRDEEFDDDEPYVVIEKRSGSPASFLWGLAIGAGLALLFAPDSGEETRRRLGRSARRVRSTAQDAAEDLRENVSDKYQHARQAVEDRIDSARQAIELKKAQATEAIRAGREAAQQARDELERRIAETKAAYRAGADVARRNRPLAATAESTDDDDIDSSGA